ncbi:MAG TPA: hypothetical protein VGD76_14985 [Ramlibacter sp.]
MNELHVALLVTALAVALAAAGIAARRGGTARRGLRRMLAAGAALGGMALIRLSLRDAA